MTSAANDNHNVEHIDAEEYFAVLECAKVCFNVCSMTLFTQYSLNVFHVHYDDAADNACERYILELRDKLDETREMYIRTESYDATNAMISEFIEAAHDEYNSVECH